MEEGTRSIRTTDNGVAVLVGVSGGGRASKSTSLLSPPKSNLKAAIDAPIHFLSATSGHLLVSQRARELLLLDQALRRIRRGDLPASGGRVRLVALVGRMVPAPAPAARRAFRSMVKRS